jgi:hypothetical protein
LTQIRKTILAIALSADQFANRLDVKPVIDRPSVPLIGENDLMGTVKLKQVGLRCRRERQSSDPSIQPSSEDGGH